MSASQVSRTVVKSVLAVETPEGAGALVRRSIGTAQLRNFTPFLMLDNFLVSPGAGFPDHPHRGMTTLTYMLKGSFQHEDFKGNRGLIGPGDLQFMIAGKGIMHAEMPVHGPGLDDPFGLQLWIDLPKQHKLTEPTYQELTAKEVPSAHPAPNTLVKVICGESDGSPEEGVVSSPVKPLGGCWFTDYTIKQKGEKVFQRIPQGWNAFIYTLSGSLLVGPPTPSSSNLVEAFHTAVLSNSPDATGVTLESASDEEVRFVVISGEPLDQEVVQHGPFVMTSREGIIEAFRDYQAGRNGFEGAHEWKSEIGGR
ncbi:pirin family protein [Sporobolomyces salmoneus]|uniref:pirin family protein n=1 Tax=Sporobolomyces salmoneus TaxID=183962 RepID=UPI00316F2CF9